MRIFNAMDALLSRSKELSINASFAKITTFAPNAKKPNTLFIPCSK